VENKRSHTKLSFSYDTIHSGKIPAGFHNKKIAFLSDLHNNEFGKDNERIIKVLELENPDYVFVGGDMLVSKMGSEYGTALTLLEQLAKKYPVYCGNGNHEARLLWKAEEKPESGVIYEEYISAIKKAGVHHICNNMVKIMEGEDCICLSEIDLPKPFYKKLSSVKLDPEYMEKQIGHCEKENFQVLLAHNPAYFDTYARWGADLTLSGHVHGGIMRLPFLGGVIDPAYHLFPKYDAGLFEKDGKKMIISVGLGTHSIKIRLFNPPKINIITLKSY
jgi:predicted MPP superfamily phosphohydrolase